MPPSGCAPCSLTAPCDACMTDDVDTSITVPAGLRDAVVDDDGGAEWLDSISDRVARAVQRWGLELGEPFEGGVAAWTAPATTAAGADVVLKLSYPHREARDEAAALAAWRGAGAVDLLGADADDWALLLRRLRPGSSLRDAHLPIADHLAVGAELLREMATVRVPVGEPFQDLVDVADWLATITAERIAPGRRADRARQRPNLSMVRGSRRRVRAVGCGPRLVDGLPWGRRRDGADDGVGWSPAPTRRVSAVGHVGLHVAAVIGARTICAVAAPVDLIIFDCDGVLVDSERLAVRTEAQLLADLGWTLTEDEIIERFVGRSDAHMLAEIEKAFDRPVPEWQQRYEEGLHHAFRTELRAVEGAS